MVLPRLLCGSGRGIRVTCHGESNPSHGEFNTNYNKLLLQNTKKGAKSADDSCLLIERTWHIVTNISRVKLLPKFFKWNLKILSVIWCVKPIQLELATFRYFVFSVLLWYLSFETLPSVKLTNTSSYIRICFRETN